MAHTIQATVMAIVFVGILLAPFVGGYLGWKHGPRHRLEARKRQMQTAILRGQVDEQLLNEAVRDLQKKGLL